MGEQRLDNIHLLIVRLGKRGIDMLQHSFPERDIAEGLQGRICSQELSGSHCIGFIVYGIGVIPRWYAFY